MVAFDKNQLPSLSLIDLYFLSPKADNLSKFQGAHNILEILTCLVFEAITVFQDT